MSTGKGILSLPHRELSASLEKPNSPACYAHLMLDNHILAGGWINGKINELYLPHSNLAEIV